MFCLFFLQRVCYKRASELHLHSAYTWLNINTLRKPFADIDSDQALLLVRLMHLFVLLNVVS